MHTDITNSLAQTQDTSRTVLIDWHAVQQKMVQLQVATQQGTTFTKEEKLALLKARAQRLAHPIEKTEVTGLQLEVTEFRLGEEPYALPSLAVREVYPFKGLTPFPCTPPCVLGVINVRGRILPVVDLTPLFGLTKQRPSEQSIVILIKSGELEVGLVTDLVIGVRSLPLATIHPPLSTLANSRARYLQGITSEGLVVIDAAKLLGSIRLGSEE